MKGLVQVFTSTITVGGLAWLTFGLTPAARAQAPYTASAHALRLWHVDDASAKITDYGNGYGGMLTPSHPTMAGSLPADRFYKLQRNS
jgi:hypothetical protein